MLFIAMALAAVADAGSDAPEGDLPESAEASHSASPAELPALRTATSNTFQLPDGEREARIYQVPVNYRDEDGDWQPIEEGLKETQAGAIVNGDNSFDVHLPEDLGEAPVRVSFEDAWVSERPVGLSTQPAELEGDAATYEAPGADAQLEFSGLPNGLKENIELAGPSAPATYRYALEASAGVEAQLTEEGAIAFRDADGQQVAEMPAPVISDSAGAQAGTEAVHYSLQADGPGAWSLAVEADPEWLADPDRAWPARIDPSVTEPLPSTLDCVIYSGDEAERCAPSNTYLLAKALYPASGADGIGRSLIKFTTVGLPDKAAVSQATINLYSAKTAQNVNQVDLYDLSHSWVKGVSWNKWAPQPGRGSMWAKPGGEFPQYLTTPTSVKTSQRGSAPGWWSFSSPELAYLVERWNDAVVPNNGVLLKFADEAPHVCCIERRLEWESSAGANKPYLSATYTLPASHDSVVSSPTDGTKTAKRFLLTAAWEHTGVTGVGFQYKTEDKGWLDIPASQVIDGNGQNVSWPYAVPKISDRESRPLYWDASSLTGTGSSAKAKVRAVLYHEPAAPGYTKPMNVEVDRRLGSPKDATAEVGPGSVDLLTGSFTIARTDVAIPGFGSALEFSRSLSSRDAGVEANGVLGPGWKPASPVEEAGGADWRKVKIEQESEVYEGETFTSTWAEVEDLEGNKLPFEQGPSGFVTPPELSGFVLTRLSETQIALTDPAGNRTVFDNLGAGSEYLPISVAQTGGPDNKTRMVWEVVEGKRRLKEVIAPPAKGVTCSDENATNAIGCHVLTFSYSNLAGPNEPAKPRLTSITYYAPAPAGPGFPKEEGSWEVAHYQYNTEGRLTAEWDPRISPALKEAYTYESGGQIRTLTPPGQQPFTMDYGTIPGESANGRLVDVKRPTLSSPATAQTTIAYGVPLSGTGAPYSMGPTAVGEWGQEDLPQDATAIFPPSEVPSSPPSAYDRATVYYMDAEGQTSNVATPSGAGTSAPSIITTETDKFGNVARELSAQNRLRALAAGSGSAAKAAELDTQYRYSKDGTELQEEIGPTHQIRLESGGFTQARQLRTIQYDKGAPTPNLGAGETWPHLPTAEITGALLADESVVDKRASEYKYNWTLRKPTETILDPEGLNIRTVTVYDATSGLPVEVRQPSNPGGAGAGTTKIVYFKGDGGGPPEDVANCKSRHWANLPCRIEPAAQTSGAGRPQLLVKKLLSYNALGEPTEVSESAGGGTTNVRKTILTYDDAGRQTTKRIEGGGTAVPKVETLYSSTLGVPTVQRFACESCDTQETATTYDTLGRPTTYKDADGNEATTTYDYLSRPVTITDAKGTQTIRYDSITGLPTELEDSAAGTFTAKYDADGNLTEQALPNGLTAKTTYDETGAAIAKTYTKTASCGASCTWLSFDLQSSINGQILFEEGTLDKESYAYDKSGRLTEAQETPTGGGCVTRAYQYDPDSNRLAMFTRAPGLGGACATSGGTEKKYSYDGADRLADEGISYDDFGRITKLPAADAGGKELTTSFFATDMVATQSQDGITNTFELDGSLRQRSRLQGGGGLEGVEVFHYDGGGDAPAWTERGSTWARNIAGLGGELAAVQDSSKGTVFQLTNLHGDVVATASSDPNATSLLGTLRNDEFGNPVAGSTTRFGWLGGKQRRTELPSGVVQMGVRSYVPAIGRFLTPDPVLGGSANAYDYANADPVNGFDLGGTRSKAKKKAALAQHRRGYFSIPNPFAPIEHAISSLAKKAAEFTWKQVKMAVTNRINEAKVTGAWLAHVRETAIEKFEAWERRNNPFAMPSFRTRLACIESGTAAVLEILASEGTAEVRAGYFVDGCIKAAATQE